jgi:hypothetical protein
MLGRKQSIDTYRPLDTKENFHKAIASGHQRIKSNFDQQEAAKMKQIWNQQTSRETI